MILIDLSYDQNFLAFSNASASSGADLAYIILLEWTLQKPFTKLLNCLIFEALKLGFVVKTPSLIIPCSLFTTSVRFLA